VIIQALKGTESVINNTVSTLGSTIESGFGVINNTLATINNGIGFLRDGIGLINNAIDSVESVLNNIIDSIESGFNNIIDSIENLLIRTIDGVRQLLTDITLGLIENIRQLLTDISLYILERVFNQLDRILEAILAELRASAQDFRALITDLIDRILDALLGENDDSVTRALNEIKSTLNNVNSNVGEFPVGCDLYSSVGSVAQGLQMLICGYAFDSGNTLSMQELANLLNQIKNQIDNLSGYDPDNPDQPESIGDKINQMHKVLAPAQFENAQVPTSLLAISGQEALIPIKNYPELFLWYIKQFDALIGEFPFEIEIEDIDLTESGNQTKKVKVANIAEGLAELFGFAFTGISVNDANMNILLRLVPEIVRIRQLGLTNQDILVANREFLGYREKEVKKEIQSNFKVQTDFSKIDELLKGEIAKYKSIEFDGKETILEYLMKLLYVAEIQKKALTISTKDYADLLTRAAENNDTVDAKENIDNWNKFVQQINDPMSQFNINEKPSRIRDIGA